MPQVFAIHRSRPLSPETVSEVLSSLPAVVPVVNAFCASFCPPPSPEREEPGTERTELLEPRTEPEWTLERTPELWEAGHPRPNDFSNDSFVKAFVKRGCDKTNFSTEMIKGDHIATGIPPHLEDYLVSKITIGSPIWPYGTLSLRPVFGPHVASTTISSSDLSRQYADPRNPDMIFHTPWIKCGLLVLFISQDMFLFHTVQCYKTVRSLVTSKSPDNCPSLEKLPSAVAVRWPSFRSPGATPAHSAGNPWHRSQVSVVQSKKSVAFESSTYKSSVRSSEAENSVDLRKFCSSLHDCSRSVSSIAAARCQSFGVDADPLPSPTVQRQLTGTYQHKSCLLTNDCTVFTF